MTKLVGYLGRCSTGEICGGIEGYFCVRCRHYCSTCACGANEGGCRCPPGDYRKWWASTGERRMVEARMKEGG